MGIPSAATVDRFLRTRPGRRRGCRRPDHPLGRSEMIADLVAGPDVISRSVITSAPEARGVSARRGDDAAPRPRRSTPWEIAKSDARAPRGDMPARFDRMPTRRPGNGAATDRGRRLKRSASVAAGCCVLERDVVSGVMRDLGERLVLDLREVKDDGDLRRQLRDRRANRQRGVRAVGRVSETTTEGTSDGTMSIRCPWALLPGEHEVADADDRAHHGHRRPAHAWRDAPMSTAPVRDPSPPVSW